jgi:hypothetical protein
VFVHNHGARIRKPSRAEEEIHTRCAQSLGGVIDGNRGTSLSHAAHDGAEVDAYIAGPHAESRGAFQLADYTRRSNDCLRWNAAGIKAVAAKQPSLDQRYACAEANRAHGADKSGCTSTDHDEVVLGSGRGIVPDRWPNSIHELNIRLV